MIHRLQFVANVALVDERDELELDGLKERVRAALQDRINRVLGTGASVDIVTPDATDRSHFGGKSA